MKILILKPFTRTASEVASYCAKALLALSHQVEVFHYDPERLSRRGGPLALLKRYERDLVDRLLNQKIKQFSPDFIFAVKGSSIFPETLTAIRKKFQRPLVNFWIDDPHCLNLSLPFSPYYDAVFTNDPLSVSSHRKAGCPHVDFLPFGCDPEIHRKVTLDGEESAYYGSDLAFVGTVFPSREEMLSSLADQDLKIWSRREIVEYNRHKLSDVQRPLSRDSPLFKRFVGRGAWGAEQTVIYNATKVCLNLHEGGINIRSFEVTGSGGFLLTDQGHLLKNLLNIGKEIVCFRDKGELRKLALYYLSHSKEREEIAQRGYERTLKDHTYLSRMRYVLDVLYSHHLISR